MIAEYLTWKIIKPLLVKSGPWIAVALLLLGIYVAGRHHGAAKWRSKYDTAVVERNTAVVKRNTAVVERNTAVGELAQARAAVDACNSATDLYKSEADARVARLEAALAEEPETITQYRDRIEVVERIIQSEDCVTAITEVAEVLKGVDPP